MGFPLGTPRHFLRLPIWIVGLALAAGAGCGPSQRVAEPHTSVLVVGIDGLEWSVLEPLLQEGRCPNMAALMKRGSFGRLATMIPTWSPVVWTSIATGKSIEQHRIKSFVDGRGREFTSSRRACRAIWNIASEYGLTTNVFGWWITWPVEEIRGVMVSGTSAAAMVDKNWKPALVRGLEHQVHPATLEERVLAVAEEAGTEERVRQICAEKVFGAIPPGSLGEQEDRLIAETLWSIQSDETFYRVALDVIPDHPADLHMVYFGGPDVAGHRFWRHYRPEPFRWSGTSPEADAALADVIPNYYEWVDEMIGELVAAVGEDTTVFVISDHGMHEQYTEKPNQRFLSGDHQDGTPGVIIAAGPGIVDQQGYDRYLRSGAIATQGSIFSITPTLLALLGVPVGQDMQTRAHVPMLTADVREALNGRVKVETHDEGFREASVVEVPAGREEEFIARMRALGYLDLAEPEEEWRLVNPDDLGARGEDGGSDERSEPDEGG